MGGGESTDNNNDAALYGSLVRVVGHQRRSLRVEVVKRQLCSLDISQQDISSRLDGRYLSAHQTAKRIQCSTLAVSRLTASVYMSLQQPQQPAHKMDVGLKVKFEGKQLKVLGYTRRTQQRGWEFSERCVELLQSYRDAFPQLFSALAASGASGAEDIDAMQVFNCSAQEARLQMDRISEWMTVNAVRKLSTVPVAVEMLGGELMQELESLVCIKLAAAAAAVETPSQVLTVPVQFLLTSSQALLRLSANQQRFSIGDRVLFVADSGAAGAIQSGASGTVVGLDAQQQQQQFRPNYRNGNRNNATEQQQQPPSNEEWIHVLLDQPAIGASDFGGMCSAGRGITVKSCALLNLSTPQPPVHRGWRQNTADSRTASTTGGFSPKQQQYKQQQRQSPVILQRPQQTTERRPKENVWQKRGARREILDSLLAARPTTNNANTSVSNATAPTTSTPASNTSPSNTPNANGRKRNEKKKEDVSNQLKSMLRIGGAEVTTIQAPQQTVVKQQPSPPQQQQPKQIPPWLLSALPTSVLQSAAAARDSSNVSEKNKQ